MNRKIFEFNKYSYEKLEGVLKEFHDISEKILKLDNIHSRWNNMRLLDSLACHEKNALKEVINTLNVGVLLTDDKTT